MQITDANREKLNINSVYAFAVVNYVIAIKIMAIVSGNPELTRATLSSISYILIAAFVWIKIDSLWEIHLERGVLILLVVFGFIFRRLGIPEEAYLSPIRWLASFVIIIALIKRWRIIPRTKPQWLLIGLLASIPVLVIVTKIESLQLQPWMYANPYPSNNILLETIRKIIFELSYLTIFEEIIFRGLIWGFLVLAGWNENKVFWAQAILFWILHFTRTPLTFIITIPLITILVSVLTKYSKQVLPGIIAHTTFNTMLPIILYFYFK